MDKFKKRLAQRMRFLADRIDPEGAPRAIGWSFTFERGKGIDFHNDRRGCRLWYYGQDDYERAHTESNDPL
jgi:hypothetical protein